MFPEGAISTREELERLVARGKHEDITVHWVYIGSNPPLDSEMTQRIINKDSRIDERQLHYKNPHGVRFQNGYATLGLDAILSDKDHKEHRLFTNYFQAWAHLQRATAKVV